MNWLLRLDQQAVNGGNRWLEFTGKQAIHADTGKPFAEVTNGNEAKETAAA